MIDFFISHPLLAVPFLVCLILMLLLPHRPSESKFVENDNIFSQAGVVVDYSKKTIAIGKRTFSVDDIKEVSWHPSSYIRNYPSICIEIYSFESPINEVTFINEPYAAREFLSRLKMAIKKAKKADVSVRISRS